MTKTAHLLQSGLLHPVVVSCLAEGTTEAGYLLPERRLLHPAAVSSLTEGTTKKGFVPLN